MENECTTDNRRLSTTLLAAPGLILLVLPLAAAYLGGVSVPLTLALMGSTFVIEYGAAPVGIIGGLDPLFVLFVLACIALGVTLLLFSLCGTLEERWPWFARFVNRTRERAQGPVILARYGILGLVPLVMILGFYFCAPVACLFGWRRDHAILLIMAGYLIAGMMTILATLGILSAFIP